MARLRIGQKKISGINLLGVIISDALLAGMLAPGGVVHAVGDTHLYLNHLEQAELQLTRTPRPAPWLALDPGVTLVFRHEHIAVKGYDPHPRIKPPIAVW